jgi:hypothetical protein
MLQHGGVKDKKLDKLFGIVPTSPSSRSPTLSSNVTDRLRFLANLDLSPPPPPPPPQNNPKSQGSQDQLSPPKPNEYPKYSYKGDVLSSQRTDRVRVLPSTLHLKRLPPPPQEVPQAEPPPVPPPVPQAVSSQEAPPRPMNYPIKSYRGNRASTLRQSPTKSQLPAQSRLPKLPEIPKIG